MIDKKPYRVTKEQAIAVKNMINGRPYIYAAGNEIPADWFAIDLLDARELIDKQESLIKEMREAISYIDCLNVNPSTTELSNTTRWSLASNKVKAILEKTKDYV